MVRGSCTFKQTDLTRALLAAKRAGVPVKIEFQGEHMTVTTLDKAAAPATAESGDDSSSDADVKALEQAIKNDDGKY